MVQLDAAHGWDIDGEGYAMDGYMIMQKGDRCVVL